MDLQVAGQGGREKGRRIRAKACRLLGMRLTRIGATDSFPLRPASRNRGSIRSFAIESPSITRNLLRVQRYNSSLPFRGSHLGKSLWTGLPLVVLQRETRHSKPRKPPYIHPPLSCSNMAFMTQGCITLGAFDKTFVSIVLPCWTGKRQEEEASSVAAPGLLRLASASSFCSTIV